VPAAILKLKPEQVRRTIALVVDDLGLSHSSMIAVRKALRKFVDEQMLPGDLVAIIRTGVGMGALQQFTSDKRQLYAAIERVKYNLRSRNGITYFTPIGQSTVAPNKDDDADAEINDLRDSVFTSGTLGALQFIVKGVGDLPGRKAVILFSDGFSLTAKNDSGGIETNGRIIDPLRRLIDDANRAGVVINSIDAKGLEYYGESAADSFTSVPFRNVGQAMQQNLSRQFNRMLDDQGGLAYLADKTGGRFFKNNNDLTGAIGKSLESEKGYYLIGYQPDEATFDPAQRRFNQLTIKLKQPGLNVKYRSGFFSISDEESSERKARAPQTPQGKIIEALSSPFGSSDVNLRLNALFTNDAANGSLIQSLLHVSAKDLTFTDEPGGMKKAVFDVAAYTFGDNGVPVDFVRKNFTFSVKADSPAYRRILEKGFVYYLNLPVKNPGAYQLRLALRDAQSGKIGAANQFIEVPNLKKGQLTISGLILGNMSLERYKKLGQTAASASTDAGSQNEESIDPQTDTALRSFHHGTVLQYTGTIFNPKLNSAKQPQINTQMRLFRDGKIVFENNSSPVNLTGQPDLQRLSFGSAIFLSPNLPPGDYVLQIIATDALAKEKRQIATQWIDFEIID
jgi:VWFA-related protein